MRVSQSFTQALFKEQAPSAAAQWHELEPKLFLDAGSPSSRLEVFRLRRHISHTEDFANPNLPSESTIDKSFHQSSTSNGTAYGEKQLPPHDIGNHELPLETLRSPEDVLALANEPRQSQVYFIRQRNSYSPLSLSRSIYQSLVNSRHASPLFQNFIQYLGERDSEVEIIPSAPKARIISAQSHGNRRNEFEFMCGIRFIEQHGRPDKSHLTTRWSFRQSATYIRGGDNIDFATCIFVTPSKSLQMRLNAYLPHCKDLDIGVVFEIQILVLSSAIANWRPYVIDLTSETDMHAAQVLGASPDDSGPMTMSNAGERQALMILDEKVRNSLSAIQHTKEVLAALSESYASACSKLPDMVNEDIATVFTDMSREIDILMLRLRALQTRLQGVENLVSSFLELNSSFALQQLARESRRENEEMRQLSERMHHLTKKATRDAAAVKVLTIITLIYLPATVVSNFFSTSFVTTNENRNIVILGDWWIFVASAIPLTLLTLYIWWVWTRITAHETYPWWWITKAKFKRQGNGDRDEESSGPRLKQS